MAIARKFVGVVVGLGAGVGATLAAAAALPTLPIIGAALVGTAVGRYVAGDVASRVDQAVAEKVVTSIDKDA